MIRNLLHWVAKSESKVFAYRFDLQNLQSAFLPLHFMHSLVLFFQFFSFASHTRWCCSFPTCVVAPNRKSLRFYNLWSISAFILSFEDLFVKWFRLCMISFIFFFKFVFIVKHKLKLEIIIAVIITLMNDHGSTQENDTISNSKIIYRRKKLCITFKKWREKKTNQCKY